MAKKANGPAPTPGDADNGKSAGKGKGEAEKKGQPHPGAKGKPGEGGSPKAGEKNGVGAKSPGSADDAEGHSTKPPQGPPSDTKSKAVGPDGVAYERTDKPSGGGADGTSEGKTEKPATKPAPPDAKGGGAGGTGSAPKAGTEPPPAPPSAVDKLFRPEKSPAAGRGGGPGGSSSGQGVRAGRGKDGSAPDADEATGSSDPVERAAARRLHAAVQRIQKARDARPQPGAAGKGDAPNPDRRRDW